MHFYFKMVSAFSFSILLSALSPVVSAAMNFEAMPINEPDWLVSQGWDVNAEGKVEGGPAPRALEWLEVSLAPTGDLVIDTSRQVPPGTRFIV